MDQHEYLAKCMDMILKPIEDARAAVKPLPKTEKNPVHEFAEEGGITVLAEYVVLNPWFWKEEDAPQVNITKLWLDGGGRDQIEVPLSFFSGRELLRKEAEISYEVEQAGGES